MRCTCTSNTDRNTLTRGRETSPRPSSAGGGASSARLTSPSAAAATTPARVGGTRTGSRKNSAHAVAAAAPIGPAGRQNRRPSSAAAARPSTNGRPAAWIGGAALRASWSRCFGSVATGGNPSEPAVTRPSATAVALPHQQHGDGRTGRHVGDVLGELDQAVRGGQGDQQVRAGPADRRDRPAGVRATPVLPPAGR